MASMCKWSIGLEEAMIGARRYSINYRVYIRWMNKSISCSWAMPLQHVTLDSCSQMVGVSNDDLCIHLTKGHQRSPRPSFKKCAKSKIAKVPDVGIPHIPNRTIRVIMSRFYVDCQLFICLCRAQTLVDHPK